MPVATGCFAGTEHLHAVMERSRVWTTALRIDVV
jgi:hypothetical protein